MIYIYKGFSAKDCNLVNLYPDLCLQFTAHYILKEANRILQLKETVQLLLYETTFMQIGEFLCLSITLIYATESSKKIHVSL